MTLFLSENPKNDLNFEFRNFQPVYEELNKKGDEKRKIENAFHRADICFRNFPEIIKNIRSQPGQNLNNLKDECKKFSKSISNPDDKILKCIIKQDEGARWLVCFGERLGGYCAITAVSSSQLRNAYGQIKSLEMRIANLPLETPIDALNLRKMQLLIPRLAYAAKREGGGLIQLSDILTSAIKSVETVGDFMRFSQFFEAILAYHKAYGGK
ncbi:type III-A CRISPR-associated protein Csm2 [Nitrosomonas sp. wSCUT-2]